MAGAEHAQVAPVSASRGALRRALPRTASGRAWWLAALVVLLAGAGAAHRMLSRSVAIDYLTMTVSEGPVTRVVTASGTVNPMLTIIVGSYISGVVQELYCDFNTRVKKGQVCAKIDPRPYQTIVEQVTADVANAKAQLVKDEAALAYAKLVYERNTALRKDGYVTQDALDAARNALDGAQAQLVVDRAAIGNREAALHTAAINLGYTNITSPVEGTVVSRNVTIGQTVAASFQTPTLFLIATDLTRMQVDASVSESDIGALREHNAASFSVESFPGRRFEASVAQIRQAPQTVQNVVTYDVVLGVDNRDLKLMPGMTATVRIVTEAREHVLRVPDQALRYLPRGAAPAVDVDPGQPRQLWRLDNGVAKPVEVVLGLDDDSNSEVLGGGLKAGDQLIVGERNGRAGSSTAPPRFGL